MATVDFTLDDVRHIVVGEVRGAVVQEVQGLRESVAQEIQSLRKGVVGEVRDIVVQEVSDMRKVIFKDVTKIVDDRFQLFEAQYEDDTLAIQQDLTVIIKRLDVVEHGHTTTRRIVDKHSKDIMYLRAVVEG